MGGTVRDAKRFVADVDRTLVARQTARRGELSGVGVGEVGVAATGGPAELDDLLGGLNISTARQCSTQRQSAASHTRWSTPRGQTTGRRDRGGMREEPAMYTLRPATPADAAILTWLDYVATPDPAVPPPAAPDTVRTG